MSDRFEDELRDHLHREASEIREFPRALATRIREDIAPHRRRFSATAQLVVAGGLALLVGLVLYSLQHARMVTSLPAGPSASTADFGCADRSVAPRPGVSGQLVAERHDHHPGYDRVVFEFDSSRVPAYEVTQQASAHFVRDASGQPVTLKGSAGVRAVFRGATAMTFRGLRDITTGLPVTEQLVQLGDFEGVTTWGIGLARPACFRVLELSNPTRLVIDFQTPEAVGSVSPAELVS